MKIRALVVALTLVVASCQTAANMVISDRLFFGTDIPAGGTVSDADWQQFVKDVITPRFPKGLTITQGNGQWMDARGAIARERVYILEVEHERSAETDAAIQAIANEYKKRFGQDAVLRITNPSTMTFY